MFSYGLSHYLPRVFFFSFQLKINVDLVGQNAIHQHDVLQHDTCVTGQMLEIRPSAAFEAGQVDGSSVSKLSHTFWVTPIFHQGSRLIP